MNCSIEIQRLKKSVCLVISNLFFHNIDHDLTVHSARLGNTYFLKSSAETAQKKEEIPVNELPIEENVNRIEVENEARSVEEAISMLRYTCHLISYYFKISSILCSIMEN